MKLVENADVYQCEVCGTEIIVYRGTEPPQKCPSCGCVKILGTRVRVDQVRDKKSVLRNPRNKKVVENEC